MSLKDERAAFMRAIAEQPDDDTARLVFADWLEEKGGEPARAAFIRLQIELAHFDQIGPKEANSASRILARAKKGAPVRLHANTVPAKLARAQLTLESHPEWLPICPSCKGHKWKWTSERNSTRSVQVICTPCGGIGHTGRMQRGFLVGVTVGALDVVLRDDEGGEWEPTQWGENLIRDFPTVQRICCVHLMPQDYDMSTIGGPHVFGWCREVRDGDPFSLFGELWDALDKTNATIRGPWADYPTSHEAINALAVAVPKVIRAMLGRSQKGVA